MRNARHLKEVRESWKEAYLEPNNSWTKRRFLRFQLCHQPPQIFRRQAHRRNRRESSSLHRLDGASVVCSAPIHRWWLTNHPTPSPPPPPWGNYECWYTAARTQMLGEPNTGSGGWSLRSGRNSLTGNTHSYHFLYLFISLNQILSLATRHSQMPITSTTMVQLVLIGLIFFIQLKVRMDWICNSGSN